MSVPDSYKTPVGATRPRGEEEVRDGDVQVRGDRTFEILVTDLKVPLSASPLPSSSGPRASGGTVWTPTPGLRGERTTELSEGTEPD